VDEVWLQYLLELNKRMRFVKANQNKPIRALQGIGPELEKLRLKVGIAVRRHVDEDIMTLFAHSNDLYFRLHRLFETFSSTRSFHFEYQIPTFKFCSNPCF
jgi:hypothetical protein